jgi:hypothetical protein
MMVQATMVKGKVEDDGDESVKTRGGAGGVHIVGGVEIMSHARWPIKRRSKIDFHGSRREDQRVLRPIAQSIFFPCLQPCTRPSSFLAFLSIV